MRHMHVFIKSFAVAKLSLQPGHTVNTTKAINSQNSLSLFIKTGVRKLSIKQENVLPCQAEFMLLHSLNRCQISPEMSYVSVVYSGTVHLSFG